MQKIPKIILSLFFGFISIFAYSNTHIQTTVNNNILSNNIVEIEVEKPKLTGFHRIDDTLYYYDKNNNVKSGWIKYNDKLQ